MEKGAASHRTGGSRFVEGYRSQREPVGVAKAAMKSLDATICGFTASRDPIAALPRGCDDVHRRDLPEPNRTILHVGDSRAWHLRAGHLTLLTDDIRRRRRMAAADRSVPSVSSRPSGWM